MQQIRFALPAVALLLSLPAVARDAAGFAGEWQMDASRSESAHQATPIGPVTLIITQKADELRIETRRGKERRPGISSETLTYRLDGSESSNAGNSGAPIKVKARWDGPKLITETSRNVQGSTVTTMCVFSLDATGKELTVDKSLTVQHGYQFEGAANTGTARDVFTKGRRPDKR